MGTFSIARVKDGENVPMFGRLQEFTKTRPQTRSRARQLSRFFCRFVKGTVFSRPPFWSYSSDRRFSSPAEPGRRSSCSFPWRDDAVRPVPWEESFGLQHASASSGLLAIAWQTRVAFVISMPPFSRSSTLARPNLQAHESKPGCQPLIKKRISNRSIRLFVHAWDVIRSVCDPPSTFEPAERSLSKL